MTKLELIKDFLAKDSPIAVAGVSRNPKKFGRQVFDKLLILNYQLFPINKFCNKIGNINCYPDVDALPSGIDKLLILTPKEFTDEIVERAHKKGIKKIWVQQMCDTDNTLKLADKLGLKLIVNECIFMFAEPKGIHRIHKTFKMIFGTLPK
ncbi:CoA-binding protein [Saccharicrinis sp. FJH62]|uniref:CoA-binding protein n=1 Tax=Saccharicrinis sp. FJH62 TaxID=3344657 RepID=UPI0035D45895